MRFGIVNTTAKNMTAEEQTRFIRSYAEVNGHPVERMLVDSELNLSFLQNRKQKTVLIAASVSVFGDKYADVVKSAQTYAGLGASIYFISDDIYIDGGMRASFAENAEVCLKLYKAVLSIRNRGVVASIRRAGKTPGRKLGSRNRHSLLDGREEEIRKYLRRGMSRRAICREIGVSLSCLCAFVKRNHLEK